MGFETLGGDRPRVIRPQHEQEHLSKSFTNGSGVTLVEGDEVNIKSDGTVELRNAGTDIPFGVVEVGGDDGKMVTVGMYFLTTLSATSSGNLSVCGTLVKPTGAKVSGAPVYVAAVDGDWISGMVVKGALTGLPILVGIFRSPIRNTAPGA